MNSQQHRTQQYPIQTPHITISKFTLVSRLGGSFIFLLVAFVMMTMLKDTFFAIFFTIIGVSVMAFGWKKTCRGYVVIVFGLLGVLASAANRCSCDDE